MSDKQFYRLVAIVLMGISGVASAVLDNGLQPLFSGMLLGYILRGQL